MQLDRDHLRQSVFRRVFGDADPVRVGRYTILDRLGAGGMGIVFKAYDNELDRKVAVKLIHGVPERRLVNEAQALARLSHPNVVHVYEVGRTEAGELFLAMEFIDGVNLRQWLTSAARSWRDKLHACLQAGEGLSAAHSAELVHRDVKPENVLVGIDGRVRVADFGLARTIGEPERASTLTSSSPLDERSIAVSTLGFAGTPVYMAPEQLDGQPCSPASDQFSFCATLFEVLYGVRPFEGSTMTELRIAIAEGALRLPRERGGVPSGVHRAILRGLAERPEQRHASMTVLLGEIRRGLRTKRVRRWSVGVATAAITAAVGSVYLFMPPSDGESDAAAFGESDRLLVARAENLLHDDPTAAIELLGGLSSEPAAWPDMVDSIAREARLHGLAWQELTLPERVIADLVHDAAFLCDDYGACEVLAFTDGAPRSLATWQRPAGHLSFGPWMLAFSTENRPQLLDGGRVWFDYVDDALVIAEAQQGVIARIDDAVGSPWAVSKDGSTFVYGTDRGLTVARSSDGIALLEVERVSMHPLVGRNDVAIDATGERITFHDPERRLVVLEVASDRRHVYGGPFQEVSFVEGQPRVLMYGDERGIVEWNYVESTERVVSPPSEPVLKLEVSASGRFVAATHGTGEGIRLDVWDLHDRTPLRRNVGKGNPGRFAPRGDRLGWIDDDGVLHIYDLVAAEHRRLKSKLPIEAFVFAPDGLGATTIGSDRSIRRWRWDDRKPMLPPLASRLAISPDSRTAIAIDRDNTLRSFDLSDGTSTILGVPEGRAYHIELSRDGQLGLTANMDTVSIWDLGTRTLLAGQHFGAARATFAGNDRVLVCTDDGLLTWNVRSGEEVVVDPDTRQCSVMAVDDEGRFAATVSGEKFGGALRVFSLEAGTLVRGFPEQLWSHVGFISDGTLIVGRADGPAMTVDPRTGETTPAPAVPASYGMLPSQRLLGWEDDEGPQLYDPHTGFRFTAPWHNLAEPKGRDYFAQFSLAPDHSLIAVDTADGTALLDIGIPGRDELPAWIRANTIARYELR